MSRTGSRKKRVWLGGLAVLTLLGMVTAVPGLAAPPSSSTKQYKIEVTSPNPNTAPANTAGQTFRVKITNATPDGNSTINSFDLSAPADFVVTNATVLGTPASSNPNASAIASWKGKAGCTDATCPSDDNVVWVQFLDPVKSAKSGNGQFVSIDVTVTTPDIEGCSAEATGWGLPDEKDGQPVGGKTIVYSGSNRSGQTFNQTSATNTTTTLTKACALQIVLSKTAVNPNESFTATVTAPDTSFSNDISLAVSPSGGVTFTKQSQSEGVATFSIVATNTGAYTATASATGADSASATFSVFAGDINCGDTRENNELTRGNNKDGSTCVIVDYTYTSTGFGDGNIDNDLVTLEWDTVTQVGASFKYTKTWDPEAVSNTSGLPTRVTKLAWQKDTDGNWIFEDGRACWDNKLPTLYATLAAGINDSQTSISVTGASGVPATPFDVMIGNERLRVTATNGSWTVERGVGGTAAAAHDSGSKVMSTPLPIHSGAIVPMCIAQEGWSAYGQGLVQFTTTVFDIGDGAMKR